MAMDNDGGRKRSLRQGHNANATLQAQTMF
jgi:hypothetical protein